MMKAVRKAGLPACAVLCICCMFGCAGKKNDSISCSGLTAPNTYKIYLHVSRENDPNGNVARSLEKKTDLSLFQLNHEVKVLQDIASIGSDGLLLKIEVIGGVRTAFSKRIGIRYQLINNSNKQVLFNKVEEMSSKMGGEKITIKMSQNIARTVDDLVTCIQKSRIKDKL